MNSVPEILLGKPSQEWTRGDVWAIRLLTSMAGYFLWLLLIGMIKLLQPKLFLPWAIVVFVGIVYMLVLLALACRAVPVPVAAKVSQVLPPVEEVPARQKKEVKVSALLSKIKTTFRSLILREKPSVDKAESPKNIS